ncbi:MAG TPA: hypothetical protein VGZ02_06000 [Candidatus Baltobacteraceae bacterium]|nr:hypothetical protein [Candidatus Baltobacteraceae bacterium]
MFARTLFVTALAAALLSACGGGGGGSSTPPLPGGGNNPSPAASGSPHASSAPSATPGPGSTPTPFATPTPLPTPTPTPAGAGQTILPNTTGRFSLIQVIDLRMTQQQIQAEAPYEDAVWAAFSPSTWNQSHPGMITSRYMIPLNDENAISGHDLTWWQQNHPDWILYTCDSNGNPTHYVARDDGFPDVPLDFHNPQVIDYQVRQMLGPYMIANGYNALALDQVSFSNYTSGPNAILGQSDPGYNYGSDGWYGCGVWEGSTFVKRYTMGYLQPDPAFIADIVNWVKTARQILTTDPTLAPYHLKLLVNHPLGELSDPNEQAILSNVDGIMNENGFSNYNRYGINVGHLVQYMQYAQANHVAFFSINYFCLNGGSPCETSVTPQQLEFAMAAYQMGNEGGAALYVSPSTGEIYSYHPEFATRLGTPCAEYSVSGTVYYRKFTGGLAIVNNSFTPSSLQLPAHAYTDIEGRSVTNPLQLGANDGYVLTTTNGCS